MNHDLLVSGTALPLDQWYVQYPIHNFLVNPLLVVMLKAPMILADVATGILLFRGALSLGLSQSRARLAFKVWMLNPIVIWISTASGHFDIIPTFFALYALTSALNGRLTRASFSLGLGGVWKLWPFLLLPVLLLFSRKHREGTLTGILRRYSPVVLITFIPIIVMTAIYLLLSSPLTFRAYDPTHQPVGYGILLGYILPIPANPFGGIPLTLTALVVLTTIILFTKFEVSAESANGLILVLLLTVLSLSPISTQYLLWPLPFLLLDWILTKERLWFFTIVSAIMFGLLLLSLDRLGFGFYFSAIIPEWVYSSLTGLSTEVSVLGVLRSIFVGVTIFYAFTLISLMRSKGQMSH